MKLGVIGEPCIDYIHREGKETARQLGGILYSVVSLAVLAKKHEVYPIMYIGEDEFDYIGDFLSKFHNIRPDYIFKSTQKTRVVKLFYASGKSDSICRNTYDREESSTKPAPSLNISQILPAAGTVGGLLLNMVSGLDINLDTLKLLKEKFQGYIHMDLHNIVMRTGNDGTRFRGPVRDWLNWSTNCDTLQMNEAEASVISTEGFKEYNTAEKILRSGKVKAVIITRGNRGVMMYRIKSGNSSSHPYDELDKTELPPVETQKFKDSTGCGDVFASAFFYKSIENNQSDFPASLHFANRMASLNSELEGVEELGKLND